MGLAAPVFARKRAFSSAVCVLLAGVARTSHRNQGVHAFPLKAAKITAAIRAAPAARAKRDVEACAVREARAVLRAFLEPERAAIAITRKRHAGIAGISPAFGGFPSSVGAGKEEDRKKNKKNQDA